MSKINQKNKKAIVKRRLASVKECMHDLQDEIPLFFLAYEEACGNYNKEIILTPPESRCRGFEASLFISKLINAIQKYFPDSWKYGKYKRFILYKKGYLVLFKKLDNNGLPMNIKTKIVESINLQKMGSLFDDPSFNEEPILYFGYKKDKIGNIYQPQVVYIDENKIRWSIEESDIIATKTASLRGNANENENASPKLRKARKKASNE